MTSQASTEDIFAILNGNFESSSSNAAILLPSNQEDFSAGRIHASGYKQPIGLFSSMQQDVQDLRTPKVSKNLTDERMLSSGLSQPGEEPSEAPEGSVDGSLASSLLSRSSVRTGHSSLLLGAFNTRSWLAPNVDRVFHAASRRV